MTRKKKGRTDRVQAVLTPQAMALLKERAAKERRTPSQMAALLIEDGLTVLSAQALAKAAS